MNITLGGDRLGAGNKNNLHLHNYFRSTHNLSERFTSTMGCGMLVPCLVKVGTRGDVFDIKINGAARTLPTTSPLFSTFKFQIDILFAPFRLYQGILHNNPLHIGLNMSDVKFPRLKMECYHSSKPYENAKMADTSLMKYLGLSGLGRKLGSAEQTWYRYINAMPMLAYYDICKNYYANKQEDDAYICGSEDKLINVKNWYTDTKMYDSGGDLIPKTSDVDKSFYPECNTYFETTFSYGSTISITYDTRAFANSQELYNFAVDNLYVLVKPSSTINWYGTLRDAIIAGYIDDVNENDGFLEITFAGSEDYVGYKFIFGIKAVKKEIESVVQLQNFKLKNIDNMRLNLLSYHTLGSAYTIDKTYSELPYSAITALNPDTKHNKYQDELNGLFIKTYQADLFNAWVNTDWIEGENGIAEMTKIAVSDGSIYIDAMLLAEKSYNMLNRIAVSDGTYESWQDVVYQQNPKRHLESPIYCGGESNEICFEEIVQTTPTEGKPLGTLGGRGIALHRKGGKVAVKCDEAGFIIGICSITPRIYYTQGNEFYMTELQSMDDLHKPAMDGIGLQDLLGERMCWTDTRVASNGYPEARTKVGKVPAWIEYMTAVDKAFGEFCDPLKQGSMILNRMYEYDGSGAVQDFTTYIDPSKYNYAFGEANLLAQNFWVQIDFDIKKRGLISAKQIPNL